MPTQATGSRIVGACLLLAVLSLLDGCSGNPSPSQPDIVVPRLIALLKDPSPDARRTAALSLGKIARPEAAGALVERLNDPDPLVRQYSAWALGSLGEAALDQAGLALVRRLGDPAPDVKAAAALALGNVGATQGMVELVTEALQEADPETRRAAVQALGWLETPSASVALVKALGDPDGKVRQGAIAALGELADPRALPFIQDLLARDSDAGVRSEAAFRLGKFGDQTALPALRSATARDADPGVRRWASWALDQIQKPATPTS